MARVKCQRHGEWHYMPGDGQWVMAGRGDVMAWAEQHPGDTGPFGPCPWHVFRYNNNTHRYDPMTYRYRTLREAGEATREAIGYSHQH
jgi:hypothetical protein